MLSVSAKQSDASTEQITCSFTQLSLPRDPGSPLSITLLHKRRLELKNSGLQHEHRPSSPLGRSHDKASVLIWWYRAVITSPRRHRQKAQEFKVVLDYIVTLELF